MSDKNLPIIKTVVHQYLPGSRILLFGSRARRTNREDSDYDILVLIDKELTPKERMPFRTAIRVKLIESDILSEILVQSESEVNIKKNWAGHIIRTALQEGIWL